ncbi:MAG TPA: ribonuclease III [Anaerolineales bacterium]|nr:ribonuclease III [Anaerolineales bacterium]
MTLLEIQQNLGYEFRTANLLAQALTHRSVLNELPPDALPAALPDNERLEFLGDAIFHFVVAAWLFERFPQMDEGRLTRLRAALVHTEQLAKIANALKLGDSLQMGRGELESGGQYRNRVLCSTLEAVIGAVYLDSDLASTRAIILRLLEAPLQSVLSDNSEVDNKSLFQEKAQAQFNLTPTYHTMNAEGPDHAKQFTVEVRLGTAAFGTGVGTSKQRAAQQAAAAALAKLAENESLPFEKNS